MQQVEKEIVGSLKAEMKRNTKASVLTSEIRCEEFFFLLPWI